MARSDENTIHRPSMKKLRESSEDLKLKLNDKELEDYKELVDGVLEAIETVETVREPQFPVQKTSYSNRSHGYRPSEEEDPYNVWITKCTVDGADSGLLEGKSVSLKDGIALAGYNMTAGSKVLDGFVPKIDATIVSRLLEAGATISGKVNMESFATSASGDVCDFGPVLNPHNDEYLAGGSSSGSAAAVAAHECDISIGGDQGGSIRIPSSWCGVVGLKPTTGLVPYTGAMSLEFSFDTLGPIARTVEDVAKTLEVIAGEDIRAGVKMDDRQPVGVEADNYTDALKENIEGASIGILENGFDWEFSHPEVDSAVIDATEVLNELEAETEHVTMDLHDLGLPLLLTMAVQGISRMGAEASVGTNHNGWFWTHLAKGLGKAQRSQSHDLPFTVKTWLLAAEHLHDEYGIEYYSKAKNIALEAERRYNVLFDDYDAIVLPTVPVLPNKVETDLDRLEMAQGVERTHNMSANTAMFSLTHHPAISVPCATVEDDLPVGMMFVADHFDEKSLIRCASAYEREANVSLYNN